MQNHQNENLLTRAFGRTVVGWYIGKKNRQIWQNGLRELGAISKIPGRKTFILMILHAQRAN